MFWKNLKAIVDNSPLALSDTYDPKDVSLNRQVMTLAAIFVFTTPGIVLVFFPEHLGDFLPYWQGAATYLGAQMASNIIKRKLLGQNISQTGGEKDV